jgi:hypothetical protein
MALAITRKDQLKDGDKVTVAAFEATVVRANAVSYTVEVMADDGSISFIALTRIVKKLPFEDGKTYMDLGGVVYTFNASGPGDGFWTRPGGPDYVLSYPTRPLKPVTVGDAISE